MVGLCAAALIFSDSCRKGAAEGMDLCLRVLTPSLFPMLALSGMAVRTGLCQRVGRLLEQPARSLFGLSGAFAPVILLSLIGGYPVGARAVSELYRSGQVSEKQAKRAALFCVSAGPGFLISFVGNTLYGSTEVGAVLLLSQTAAVLLTGIGLRFLSKPDDYHSVKEISSQGEPLSSALVESAYDASKSMVMICGLVLLFSAFGGICDALLPSASVRCLLMSALEVSSGVCALSEGYPFALAAFAVGFGGVCVHFQVFAALGKLDVSKPLFFLMRIIQGILTALFARIGLFLTAKEVAVFSTAEVSRPDFYGGSVLSGAALLTVAICFLLTLRKR